MAEGIELLEFLVRLCMFFTMPDWHQGVAMGSVVSLIGNLFVCC